MFASSQLQELWHRYTETLGWVGDKMKALSFFLDNAALLRAHRAANSRQGSPGVTLRTTHRVAEAWASWGLGKHTVEMSFLLAC